MSARKRIIHGIVAAGAAFTVSFSPLVHEKPLGLKPAYAQARTVYNTSLDPLAAGPGITALAQKAKSDSQLESAKKLHSLLRVDKGGLKESSSGKTIRDDRLPRTAEQTLVKGGDCTEFAYVVLAALNKMGIKSGLVALKAIGNVYHVLPYAEIDGKRYLIDPQTKEFGKGTIQLRSGQMSFTYGKAKKRIVLDMGLKQAKGFFHMEAGNHLKTRAGKEEQAAAALKRSLELFPENPFAKRKLTEVQGKLVNIYANKGIKLFNNQKFKEAAEMFGKAINSFPESMKARAKAQLQQLVDYKKQAEQAARK